MEKCPKCLAKEIDANTPRTVYQCGSSDYDQRPDTFIQSDNCITASAILNSHVSPFKGMLSW